MLCVGEGEASVRDCQLLLNRRANPDLHEAVENPDNVNKHPYCMWQRFIKMSEISLKTLEMQRHKGNCGNRGNAVMRKATLHQ